MIDNFSRRILAWRVADTFAPGTSEAARGQSGATRSASANRGGGCGRGNVNAQVDALVNQSRMYELSGRVPALAGVLVPMAAVLDGPTAAAGSAHAMVPLLHLLERGERMAMYSTVFILALAGFAAQTAYAQDQLGRERVVKVSGCIAQAPRTGSLTDDAGAGNVASPNTAGVEANSSEPVNAYILLDATPAADGAGVQREAGERTSYALQGLAAEVANHKGQRVEIVGQLLPRPAPSGQKSPAAAIQRIAVQTIKMLSARCESQQTR